jgi:hypothetical protein
VALRKHEQSGRSGIAVFMALALLAEPVVPGLAARGAGPAQAQASTQASKPKSATASAAPAAATAAGTVSDAGWPRAYQTPAGVRFMIYQPQLAEWPEQRHMTAYAAVSVEQAGAAKPALGTVKIEANTKVAVDVRMVNFSDMTLTESNFPTLPKDQVRDIVNEILKAIPDDDRVIALDRVLAQVDKSSIAPKNAEGVKADPPTIFFSKTPAVLVNLDGEPIWNPIKDNDLKYAVNTNWDLFQHGPTNTYYLLREGSWLTAADLKGPWTAAGKLPESFSKLPNDANWTETRAAVPGKKLSAKQVPQVFVSQVPAELILLTGEPSYLLVNGTALLWVNNTESDVFRLGRTGPVYYLVAGRWFSAPDFTGPWTFATPKLPADFAKIPLEHPRSRVLASVPGTQQAAEAVLLAQIPQTARISKKQVKAPEVSYSGNPEFRPIETTNLQYAVNTDKDIIKMGDLYYMCFQGVWFMSKNAEGPWEVCSSVPKEIYSIPTSSPVNNVTYVTVVEEDSNDEWVTFATVAAYTGVMIAWGCCVWGSGYYYPPYYGGGFYYPHYPTYGYGARYNPWTGAYSRGVVAYGPYGGAGMGARYNPRTGTYSRGAAAWGPGGGRGYAEAYNPRTGAYGATRQGSNVYGSWGSTGVQRGDDWARTSRVTNNRTGTTTRVTQGSGGGTAVTRNGPGASGGGVARTGSGDVYAGRDGNVYRNEGSGWQKYDSGGWNNVETPQRTGTAQTADRAGQAGDRAGQAGAAGTTARTTGTDRSTVDQLNRDSRARSDGGQRTSDYGRARSGGYTGTSGSSYRPSGGARAGGGGGGRRR